MYKYIIPESALLQVRSIICGKVYSIYLFIYKSAFYSAKVIVGVVPIRVQNFQTTKTELLKIYQAIREIL